MLLHGAGQRMFPEHEFANFNKTGKKVTHQINLKRLAAMLGLVVGSSVPFSAFALDWEVFNQGMGQQVVVSLTANTDSSAGGTHPPRSVGPAEPV